MKRVLARISNNLHVEMEKYPYHALIEFDDVEQKQKATLTFSARKSYACTPMEIAAPAL